MNIIYLFPKKKISIPEKTKISQKNKVIDNLEQWSSNIIDTLDRSISTDPLPEGIEYNLTTRNKNRLIHSLQNTLSNKENIHFDKVNLRLIDSQAVKSPYPANFKYNYDLDVNNILFKQIIYARGDIELIIKKDMPDEVLEEPIYYKNQVLDKLTDRLISYTESIALPFPLFFGLLEGKEEVPDIKITCRDQSKIIWKHGNYKVSKKWFKKLKDIINNSGLKGLINAGWISENDRKFIENKFNEYKKVISENKMDNPYIILANKLEKAINDKWEGKTTELHEIITNDKTFPDNDKGILKLGKILTKATEKNVIPGFNIENIRIGETRQKGYRITRI